MARELKMNLLEKVLMFGMVSGVALSSVDAIYNGFPFRWATVSDFSDFGKAAYIVGACSAIGLIGYRTKRVLDKEEG